MTPNYVNSEGCYNGVGEDGERWGDFVMDRERAVRTGRWLEHGFVQFWGGNEGMSAWWEVKKGRSRKDLMWRVIAERGAVPADTDRLSESLSSLRDFAAGLGDSRR